MLIERNEYLKQLEQWRDEKVIKVITGVRRCGKSVLLQMFAKKLIDGGILKQQIIAINLEDLANESFLDYHNLYNYLEKKIQKNKKSYIFLDEIQLVHDFQKVVDSLYLRDDVDIYITGSNAYLLSGELATFLSGRYVEIKVLPFSFREFAIASQKSLSNETFQKYLKIGGFPYLAQMVDDDEKINTYLEGIYNTIILKDVEERGKRKGADETRKISDMSLLINIVKFLADNLGNQISLQNIVNYITSGGRKVALGTISDYVRALVEPFLFYPAERFNIVGKELMKTNNKYYMVDLGLRRYLLPKKNYDLGYSLENIVYFELLRHGYKVNVGKIGDKEVDFIAQKNNSYTYYQVSASLIDKHTFEREIAPLKMIKDNYRKYILTLDEFTEGNYDGIEVVNIVKWLSVGWED